MFGKSEGEVIIKTGISGGAVYDLRNTIEGWGGVNHQLKVSLKARRSPFSIYSNYKSVRAPEEIEFSSLTNLLCKTKVFFRLGTKIFKLMPLNLLNLHIPLNSLGP